MLTETQYARWAERALLVGFDSGTESTGVLVRMEQRAFPTLMLMASALLLAYLSAIALAVVGAVHSSPRADWGDPRRVARCLCDANGVSRDVGDPRPGAAVGLAFVIVMLSDDRIADDAHAYPPAPKSLRSDYIRAARALGYGPARIVFEPRAARRALAGARPRRYRDAAGAGRHFRHREGVRDRGARRRDGARGADPRRGVAGGTCFHDGLDGHDHIHRRRLRGCRGRPAAHTCRAAPPEDERVRSRRLHELFGLPGWRVGLVVLAALGFFAIFAEWIAADVPVFLEYRGRVVRACRRSRITGRSARGQRSEEIAALLGPGDRAVWPLLRWGPADRNERTAWPAPRPAHPLGTDAFGRDVLARLVYATRASLALGATIALSCRRHRLHARLFFRRPGRRLSRASSNAWSKSSACFRRWSPSRSFARSNSVPRWRRW